MPLYCRSYNSSGELQRQKLKSHLLRTQSLKVLPLRPGVGQYIAAHATLAARYISLLSSLSVHSSAFFQNLSQVFPVLAVALACVGLQNKIGHPAHYYRQLIQVPVLSACGIHLLFSRFVFWNCGFNLSCGLREKKLVGYDLWNE